MRLKKFNRKKALRQFQFKQNKSKYIKIGTLTISILILIISIIYYTRAKFTTTQTMNIVQTTVANFKYNITYNLDGGSATNPSTYLINDADFTLNNPTKDGYTFKG